MTEPLAPRLLKNIQTEYERATFSGTNTSGIKPLGKSLVILTDRAAGKSSGGILTPDDFTERMNMASESGVIIACGAEAFAYYDDGSKWTDYKPQPGDRVMFERYAGREFQGQDGAIYRIMTYTCIGGIEIAPEPVKPKKKG